MSQRFISESDIEETKKRLKDAWDATKGENDPEDPPEELQVDNRPLYHRLEEQKLKKQEEYEDAHRLKNMVRGLEDDEVEFLALVDRSKMEQERRVRNEETTALTEFRKKRAEIEFARSTEKVSTAIQSGHSTSRVSQNSQKFLLSGAVKRKSDNVDGGAKPSKQLRTISENGIKESTSTLNSHEKIMKTIMNSNGADENIEAQDQSSHAIDKCSSSAAGPPTLGPHGYLQVAGTLPGLGPYSDTSDSVEDSSSDSDEPPIPVKIRQHKKHKKGGCC